MHRVAIVSNRLPPLRGDEARAGGLAVGLGAALRASGGTWLGWDGTIADRRPNRPRIEHADGYALASLSLSEREYREYYLGFANRTLWPVLHGRVDLLRFEPSEHDTYRAVNDRFARRLADMAAGLDLVWVHDYHLFYLGKALRGLGITLPVGFFLHVPFPPPETLAALPCHLELLKALSAYDLVGFQTEADVRNFCEAAARYLGAVVSPDGRLSVRGRQLKVAAFPVGIDTTRFEALAASAEAAKLRRRLGDVFAGRLGVIGVDRLDYTKGLPERLRAFERLLESLPRYRRRAFLLQIAAPSREEVPEYAELRGKLESLSGRINARHAGLGWTPVCYLNRTFSHARLAALYRLSRVGLVTPLRDGMNLVAKEYIAAQTPQAPGVLVLSRFAGAAERLHGALLVNPYDIDAVAKALRQALEMPLDERCQRWSALIGELRAHDVHDWHRRFLQMLGDARPSVTRARAFVADEVGKGLPPARPPRPVRHLEVPQHASSSTAWHQVTGRPWTVAAAEGGD